MKKLQKGFTLIELMIVVAIIGIIAAIAIPQYQNYTIRSQVNRVVGETSNYKTAFEYCVNNGRLASVNSNAGPGQAVATTDCVFDMTASNLVVGGAQGFGVAPPAGQGYPQAAIANDGSGTIVATFGNNAAADIATDTVTWTRDTQGNWACASTADDKYNSAGCP